MAKKSRMTGTTVVNGNPKKLQVFKQRALAKFRALRHMAFAKDFLYMDRKVLVGAFSNEDLEKYLEHMELLVDRTNSIYSELQSKSKKGGEPTNTRKKAISEFDAMLERVKKNSK